MARLSPAPGAGRGDRGQLILIAGFVIAVSLIGLALVLNAAIFTENLATRSDTSGAVDALSYRSATERGLGEMLVFENDQHPNDPATAEDHMEEAVAEYSEASTRQQALEGRVVDVSFAGSAEGRRLFQTEDSRNFNSTDADNDRNWELARDASNVRRFRIGVSDQGRLTEFDSNADAFRVVVNESGQEWQFNVTRDNADEAVIGVTDAGNDEATCRETVGPDDDFWINVTAGTVAGVECEPLQFAEGVPGGYDVYYLNSTKIQGNYSLVVGTTNTPLGNYGPESDGPVEEETLYSVTADLVYRTPDLNYTTAVRVAPGEPDE